MFSFEWPWMFLFLPLPLLVLRYTRSEVKVQANALRVPAVSRFEFTGYKAKPGGSKSYMLKLIAVVWVLMVISAARPQWLGEITDTPSTGRDLMLGVDLSASMQNNRDFRINGRIVNRFEAAKKVVLDFIKLRKGDRIGLIVFGTRAYVYVPMTFDTRTVATLLKESYVGLAGGNTAIGDTIILAVKHLARSKNKNKVLILLTDGQNTAGSVLPRKAAEIAKMQKLKIYTIGVGSPSSRSLNEGTLRYIASLTGGTYYRAQNFSAMKRIYNQIDDIEKVKQDPRRFRPVTEMFYWFLAAALLIVMFAFLSQPEWRRISDV